MKHLKLTLSIAATALLTLPTFSVAADEKPEGKRPGGRFSPEERLKKMTETLGLTQEQQDKVKAIQEKNAPAMKELFAKGRENLTEDDKTKMKELMKTQMEEISGVLTPEQKEKYKAEMEKRRTEGGPRGGKPGEGKKPEAK
jgi:Spy/CpxP family protein refolding chaperone